MILSERSANFPSMDDMKNLTSSFVLIAALTATPAFAQQAPAPPDSPPTPSAQMMSAMRQVHDEMRQIKLAARAQMLGSLTPAHRTQLANLLGQYAIASNPDPRVAAAQIDAFLSPGEKNAVLATQANARTRERALMQSARQQMEASAPADVKARMAARDAKRDAMGGPSGMRPEPTPDAGRALLHLAGGEGSGMHGHGEWGPGGPGGPNR